MKMNVFTKLSLVAALALPTVAFAAKVSDPITQDNVVSGTMTIDFNTRKDQNKDDGAVMAGVTDVYSVKLSLPDNLKLQETITRQPRVGNLWSSVGISDEQRAGFKYSMNWLYKGTVVGNFIGFVAVNEKGYYNLEDQKSPLRIDISQGKKPFVSYFKGGLQSVAIAGSSSTLGKLSTKTMKVFGQTKDGKLAVKEVSVEPLDLAGVTLAQGPIPGRYPEVKVTGSFNYDRETANYYPRLKMTYIIEGKEVTDIVEGNIRWNEADYRYEFNVTFNATGDKTAEENLADNDTAAVFFDKDDKSTEADASADDDFFAVDNTVPILGGTIAYVDSGKDENDAPLNSVATYSLKANNISNVQVMNFMKLWLLAVGPTNDE